MLVKHDWSYQRPLQWVGKMSGFLLIRDLEGEQKLKLLYRCKVSPDWSSFIFQSFLQILLCNKRHEFETKTEPMNFIIRIFLLVNQNLKTFKAGKLISCFGITTRKRDKLTLNSSDNYLYNFNCDWSNVSLSSINILTIPFFYSKDIKTLQFLHSQNL